MTAHISAIPCSKRKELVFSWAQERAKNSENPFSFMHRFEDTFNVAAALGEEHITEARHRYKDATEMAAEIEALAAVRRLRHWESNHGLYVWDTEHRLKKHYRNRAA